MRVQLWTGLLAGITVAMFAPAFVQVNGMAAVAKKCKDGEPSHVAKYTVSKGENATAAINAPLDGLQGNAGDALKWMAHRRLGNCLACHLISKVEEMAKTQPTIVVAVKKNGKKVKMPLGSSGKIGPPLDGVAERYTEGELRMLVVNPKKDFPDTIMPAFHKNSGFLRPSKGCVGKAVLSAQQVEDVVAYLKTLK